MGFISGPSALVFYTLSMGSSCGGSMRRQETGDRRLETGGRQKFEETGGRQMIKETGDWREA